MDIDSNAIVKTGWWHGIYPQSFNPQDLEVRILQREWEEPPIVTAERLNGFRRHLEKIAEINTSNARRNGENIEYVIREVPNSSEVAWRKSKSQDPFLPPMSPFALFRIEGENARATNYDGMPLNFHALRFNGKTIVLETYRMMFSEWIACQYPSYTQAFRDSGLLLPYPNSLPYAGAGISVALMSTEPDGSSKFVKTKRGSETVNYPKTFFTIGGGLTGDAINDILLQLFTESGLVPFRGDFTPEMIRGTGIYADTHYHGGEHSRVEVTYMLKIGLSSEDIRKKVEMAMEKTPQTDVVGVGFISAEAQTFESQILQLSQLGPMHRDGKLIAAGEAGLMAAFRQYHTGVLGHYGALEHFNRILRNLHVASKRQHHNEVGIMPGQGA